VDHDHRVPLPGLAALLVPNATPEVDDLLTPVIDAARAAKLSTAVEVLVERCTHGLESWTDLSLYSV
jgi:hypothetical protein